MTMVRRRYDDDNGEAWDDWYDSRDDAPRSSPEDEDEELDDLDDVLQSERGVAEDSTEISMEVDEQGREVWYAQDPRIPGSSSLGNSLEEAMEGMEDRRREYREMLKRIRKGEQGESEIAAPSAEELEQVRQQYREKLKRSRERKRRRKGESTP